MTDLYSEMKEPKRGRRIRDRQRMKAKAKRIFGRNWPVMLASKHADHLKVCSCWMCGNPRRYFGEPTMQERRAGG